MVALKSYHHTVAIANDSCYNHQPDHRFYTKFEPPHSTCPQIVVYMFYINIYMNKLVY